MSSSNSFNICPRCGNSNSLNAKYCSRCGATLKIPTEAVVCHKCHTRNSSLANFCRNCGATLKVGAQTKICPRCGREIGAEENICACGYSFVTLQQTEPRRADVSSTNKEKKKDKKREKDRRPQQTNNEVAASAPVEKSKAEKKPKQKKHGRGFAFFALIFLAAFIYVIIAPSIARPAFLTNFDQGFYHHPKDSAPETPEGEGGEATAVVVSAEQLFAEGDEGGEGEAGEENPTEPTETDPSEGEGEGGEGTTEPENPENPSQGENEGENGGTTDPETPSQGGNEGEESGDTEPTNPNPSEPAPTNPEPTDPNPANPDNTPATGGNEGDGSGAPDGTNTDNAENPDEGEQEYIYGWSLIDLVIKFFTDPAQIEAMNSCPEGKVAYVMEQLGQGTFVIVAMLALFLLTAALHLVVCLARLISPRRSRHANLLYLILAVVTTLVTAMMLCAHFLPEKEGFIGDLRNFFAPRYNGIDCAYGYALIFIPVYYWFFWLYSHIAKKAAPKKDKK